MKKSVKILIIILLVVLVIFIGNIIRKFLVLDKIANSMSNFDYFNFYHKSYIEGHEEDLKIYRVCNNVVIQEEAQGILVSLENEAYVLDKDNSGNNIYIKADNSELTETNVELNYFDEININEFKDKLELSLKSNIKVEEFNGKKCYVITTDNVRRYFDKETLYMVGVKAQDGLTEYHEIEFGTQKVEDYTLEKILEGYAEFTYPVVE